jgi:hypothetical protein
VEYRFSNYQENLWIVMTRVDTLDEMKTILKRKQWDGMEVRGRTPGKKGWTFYHINKQRRLCESKESKVLTETVGALVAGGSDDADSIFVG